MRAFSSHQPRPPTGSNPPVRKATLAKRAPERWASCCCSRIRSEVNRLRFTQTCRRNIQFQSGPARVEPVEGRSQHRCGRQLSHPAEMLRMPAGHAGQGAAPCGRDQHKLFPPLRSLNGKPQGRRCAVAGRHHSGLASICTLQMAKRGPQRIEKQRRDIGGGRTITVSESWPVEADQLAPFIRGTSKGSPVAPA